MVNDQRHLRTEFVEIVVLMCVLNLDEVRLEWPRFIVYCFTAQSVDNRFEINQHVLQNLIKNRIKIDLRGRWKGSRSPTGCWKGAKASGRRKPWFVDPPEDPPLAII